MDFLGIKVGDIVCDCRYKHLKVVEVKPDEINGKVVDLTLVLEDGSNCSAKHCVDAVPHDWAHPSN